MRRKYTSKSSSSWFSKLFLDVRSQAQSTKENMCEFEDIGLAYWSRG